MGSSHLKLVGTTTMKLLVAIALAAVGVAAEPGFYRGYGGYYGGHRGYGGYHYLGKRSADAEAVATADADAEPGGYGGYVHYLGKRSADADAEPGFYRGCGGYGGYRGYGGYGHYRGKRSADAEAVATAD